MFEGNVSSRKCKCGCGGSISWGSEYIRSHRSDATRRERFMAKLRRDDKSGCWLWVGSINTPRGYGVFRWAYKQRPGYAHRASYRMFKGEVPDGLYVCHTCDVRRCVNPDHLFLGTQADNIADAARKGRTARGEKGRLAKLTRSDVLSIRREYAGLPRSAKGKVESGQLRLLAQRYGVSTTTILDVRA